MELLCWWWQLFLFSLTLLNEQFLAWGKWVSWLRWSKPRLKVSFVLLNWFRISGDSGKTHDSLSPSKMAPREKREASCHDLCSHTNGLSSCYWHWKKLGLPFYRKNPASSQFASANENHNFIALKEATSLSLPWNNSSYLLWLLIWLL